MGCEGRGGVQAQVQVGAYVVIVPVPKVEDVGKRPGVGEKCWLQPGAI